MEAYVHGIKGLEGAFFIADMDHYFWSASSSTPNGTSFAWAVILAEGRTYDIAKVNNVYRVVCVR